MSTPTNTAPVCNHILRGQGQPYPRTCGKCGLGPCNAHNPTPSGYVQKAMELADEYGDTRIMVSRGRLPRAEVDEARESLRLHLESAFSKKAEASPAEEGRDAARYRELRRLSMLKGWWPKEVAAVLADTRGTHAEFDAAVDAAITATKEPKHE